MIVYHVCQASEVPCCLAEGLLRHKGRHYVFSRWELVQSLLFALVPNREEVAAIGDYVVLSLKVDADILVPGPIPLRQSPVALRAEDLKGLQENSRFLEMDLSPARILDIKDPWGNSVASRYRASERGKLPIWRFLAYLKPYWRFVALATVAGIVKFLAPLVFPWMLRVMLDEVTLNQTLSTELRWEKTTHLILAVLLVNGIWMLACYYRSVWAAFAGHRMIRDLRVALFDHVQRLSHSFFTRNQSGAIVSRVVHDLNLAQNFVGSALTNVWMDSVLLLVLVAILLSIHPTLTAVSLLLMPIYVISLRVVGSRIRLISREAQQRLEILSASVQEKVMGVGIVKAFTRESQEEQAFASQANKLLNKVMFSVRSMATNEMLVGLVVHTSPVLVAWYGVNQILAGRLTVGELTQFLLYLAMFYFPLQRLSDLGVVLANAVAAIERIFEYFDTQPQVMERAGARHVESVRGRIEFDHVIFGYEPDVTVLKDICLSIEPGETVAFVGPSGSGKSTLANLIPRFYDPNAGAILLDGLDLRDLKLDALRRQIGIVNQETILFSGTIQENLLLANPEAGIDDLRSALEAAYALEFVEQLPEGLWTEIGERGASLSGGQKQRLAIARAFLKDPKILILDEATSALDSHSERQVQQGLARLLKDRTSLVIAHRLSTILGADKIVVLDAGRIIATGKHEVLLRECPLYAQFCQEQFGELAAYTGHFD